MDPTKFIDVAKRLTAIPEVAMAFHTSGGHDIFLVLWTKDRESLAKFVNSINSIDGVINVIPSFIVERLR